MRVSDENGSFDWHQSDFYDSTAIFARQNWGWEYLRRNPEFRVAWRAMMPTFETVAEIESVTVIKASRPATELRQWGCLFASAPTETAMSAPVLWRPGQNPNILHAIAVSDGNLDNEALFSLPTCQLPSLLMLSPDGKQHVVIRDGARSLQLIVSGGSLLEPVYLAAETRVPAGHTKGQIKAFQCFQDFRQSGRLLDVYFPRDPRNPRLRFVLQALDGCLTGASHREIAIALFGADRVERDWRDPGEHLRDRVRRAIQCGRDFMDGGYREFLR